MKHKILLLLFLFSLLPSWGWGQETEFTKTINFAEEEYEGGYTILQNGTYTFKGTFKGKPAQDIGYYGKKAVINVVANLNVTIILDNVTIDLSDLEGCPLSAKNAKTVNLLLKGTNTLKIDYACPGIWAPEGENCGIIINEELGSSGLLNVKTNKSANLGIGWRGNQFENSYIDIHGGTINAIASYGVGNSGNSNSSGGKITITGGTVTTTSTVGVGIGGANNKITITGGTVITNNEDGAGIGGLHSKITITGGTVITNSESGDGIGVGFGSSSSTFSTSNHHPRT